MRRLLIALTALASIATASGLVAGCSSSKQAGELPDATTLVKESSTATKGLKSAHLVINVAGKIEKLPVKTLEGDLTNVPAVAAKGETKVTLLGSDIDVKFVVIDGDLYGAMSGDEYDNFGPAAKIYDVSAILDPERGLGNMLASFTDAKADGKETINKQDTIRITGKVPAAAVNDLAPQLNATEPMPSTVWIQSGGDHQLVQAQLDPSPGNSIQMTLSDWNVPVTVEKPAGA